MMDYMPGTSGPKTKGAMLESVMRLSESPIVKSRLADRNTLEYTDEKGVRRIRLHNTDILTVHPDGGFEITTGGWNTVTTRDRLNKFLPRGKVHTSKGVIYYGDIPFRERLRVTKAGKVISDMNATSADKYKKLVDAYMKAFRERGLPKVEESKGDPWIFSNKRDRYKVDREVMLDWLRSKYVHRLLYILALQYANVSDNGIAINLWRADERGLDKYDYQRIRRYIRACLGLAA